MIYILIKLSAITNSSGHTAKFVMDSPDRMNEGSYSLFLLLYSTTAAYSINHKHV